MLLHYPFQECVTDCYNHGNMPPVLVSTCVSFPVRGKQALGSCFHLDRTFFPAIILTGLLRDNVVICLCIMLIYDTQLSFNLVSVSGQLTCFPCSTESLCLLSG